MAQFFIIESVGYLREGSYVMVLADKRGPFGSLRAAITEAKIALLKTDWHGVKLGEVPPDTVRKAVTDLLKQKVAIIETEMHTIGIEIKKR